MLPLINLMYLAFLSEVKNKQKTKQQYFLGLESWVNSFLVFPLHLKDKLLHNCKICLSSANAQFHSTHQSASGWNEFVPSEGR